ncbi:hypothetical protein E3T26_05535 [Cryobacterium sp. TMT1-21]|uniref:Uncharacterized protein n=1 Tax=Cryobacterium shii TaxID=1259235 RepID=A0AAQ2C841_9MICO|nr:MULTISPECIES: hypothetical protein [Cryobacterium]TFC51672.1 hypothetical protein E3O49_03255 [Cryobacterium shii]TFC83666.1 hypothetical protein E3T24_11760 [Cryobacterium sp. TmT2-59]TFD13639.1 hypothetical protein E3T42_13270 [Cryobacterium sp. TMT4-10]TFD15998.1 hypothetical protein E3T26_05535 [Cryobacterium sp. TMT1-21]TFD27089.1 hypothetical protein E3T32_02200 [Cryobacterium sp. TMT2-23]
MKNFIWFVVGLATGLLLAREGGKTRQGKQFFADLDTKAREFGEAISDGYRKREAELRDAIGDIAAEADDSIEKLTQP